MENIYYENYNNFKSYGYRNLKEKDVKRLIAAIWNPMNCDKSMRFLDLGCGEGRTLSFLSKMGVKNYKGVDFDKRLADIMPDDIKPHFKISEIQDYLNATTETYDRVLLLDVLEHFDATNCLTIIEAIKKVLACGGKLLVKVPNGASPLGMQHQAGDLTHKTTFAPNALRQISSCMDMPVQLYGYPVQSSRRRKATNSIALKIASWCLAEPPEFWEANLCAIFTKEE